MASPLIIDSRVTSAGKRYARKATRDAFETLTNSLLNAIAEGIYLSDGALQDDDGLIVQNAIDAGMFELGERLENRASGAYGQLLSNVLTNVNLRASSGNPNYRTHVMRARSRWRMAVGNRQVMNVRKYTSRSRVPNQPPGLAGYRFDRKAGRPGPFMDSGLWAVRHRLPERTFARITMQPSTSPGKADYRVMGRAVNTNGMVQWHSHKLGGDRVFGQGRMLTRRLTQDRLGDIDYRVTLNRSLLKSRYDSDRIIDWNLENAGGTRPGVMTQHPFHSRRLAEEFLYDIINKAAEDTIPYGGEQL